MRLRPWNLLLIAGILAGSATLSVASPAAAHDSLIGQSPAADATVETMPDEIELVFNNLPLDIGAIVMVVDADGVDWAVGDPVIVEDTVSQAVDPAAPDGFYQVRWRVVSSDGHPISESFGFGVGDLTNAAPIPTPSSAAEPVTDGSTGDFSLSGAQEVARQEAANDTLRIALLAGAGAVLGVGVVLLVWRLRRRAPRDTR